MGYNLLIELCVLALLAKAMDTYEWRIYWPALLSAVGPALIFFGIGAVVGRADLWSLTSPVSLVTIICQFAVALVIFNFLKLYEDTIVLWFIWLFGGGFVLYLVIPAIALAVQFG